MTAEFDSQEFEPSQSPLKREYYPPGLDLYSALPELCSLVYNPFSIYYGVGAEKGHGHPVMPLPCVKGDDLYLMFMRTWLKRTGYDAYPSHIRNSGPVGKNLDTIASESEKIVSRTGSRVTLIGHSFGGIQALYLLKTRPDLFDMAISLGSPVTSDPRKDGVVTDPSISNILRLEIPDDDRAEDLFSRVSDQSPLPENTQYYSIYTPQDHVINPKFCLHPRATGCFAVEGTHTGLAWNAKVFKTTSNLLHENSMRTKLERLPNRSSPLTPVAA